MRSLSDAPLARSADDAIWQGWSLAWRRGGKVPFIDVKVMEGVLSTEQKQAIARGFTDVIADAVGDPARAVTWVVIQDVASGHWTMGGNAVTTEGVQELLRAEPAHA
jgi:4-oxalocrotonate tautomerase